MHVTIVHVKVKPDRVDAFIDATKKNHEHSVQESGNLRFDVLQSDEDATIFVLYEAYRSAQDAATHKSTGHYLTWREQVADMMAQPREGVRYNGLFPRS